MADDINQKINIDTKADTTGLKKIEAELAALQNRLRTLGRNGATAGLERELARSAKTAERLTNQFKPTKTLVEKINREMRGLVDNGELTGAKIGVMTREIKRFGQTFKKTVELSSQDRDVWGEKILRMKTAIKAVREMGAAQQKVLERIRGKEAQYEDLKSRAAERFFRDERKRQDAAENRRLRADRLEFERGEEKRRAETKHNQYLKRVEAERSREQRRQQRWDKIDFDAELARIRQRNKERDLGQRQFARMVERMRQAGERRRIEIGFGENAFSMDVPASFKSRMQFNTRMGRQALAEEKARVREIERYRAQLRRDFEQGLYRAQENGARALHYARMPAYAALGAGAMGAAAVTRGMSGRMAMDTAETNFRIFGAEPASRKGPGSFVSSDDVRRERGRWLDRAAIENAITPKAALEAYTEMVKAGITGDKGREFTQLVLGATAGMDMPTDEVTKMLGKIAQNVPGVGRDRMKNILNSMAISAASTSADPNQIVAGMKRGMGVFAQSNMTPEQLAVFSAVGAGAGVQEGKTGNFVSELVSTVGRAGKERGQRRKDLDAAARDLGFGNARGLSRSGRADMSGTITKMLENFQKLDPSKKAITAVRVSMREWDDELMQFVNSIEKLKDTMSAVNDSRNAGFLDRAQEERMKSWATRWNRIKVTFGLFWESFGAGFDGMFLEISRYFTGVGKKFNFSTITRHVEALLFGFRKGLFGDKTWEQGLASIFGEPGQGSGNWMKELTQFGKGFATGLREIGTAIKDTLTFFSGSKNPEAIGRFTAQLIGLSGALVVLSPVISVLGLLTSGILALSNVLKVSGAVLRASGLIGATAGGAAGTAGVAAAAAGGGWLARFKSILGLGTLAGGAASLTMGMSKSDQDAMTLRLGEFARKRNAAAPPPIDSDHAIQKLREETEARQKLIDELLRPKDKIEKQGSYDLGVGGLRKLASADTDMRDLKQMIGLQGARIQLAALGSPSLAFSSSGGGGGGSGGFGGGSSGSLPGVLSSRPGSALPPSTFGRRGILGGGRIGGGAGGSGMVGFGANPGAYKPLLDHIARSEGTANRPGGGYNTSLDYGRWTGGEKNLSGMTLDEIDRLQTGMLAHPENRARYGNGLGSSALGRYQIVRRTLRSLRRQLGLNGSELYDPAMQDRLAAELARQRGANSTLGQEWASLRGGKLGTAIDLARQVPRGASTAPGSRPPGADLAPSSAVLGDPGDFAGRLKALKSSGAITNAQCVALAKAWVGTEGQSVTTWKRGQDAMAGTLKPGTPIATFLDRDGSQSSRYAGGGTGTPGANRDHAGIFESYIRDGAGKITGFRMLDQWAGRNGYPDLREYRFGDRRGGEKDAGNYAAILGADGNPLGGSNNPMSIKSAIVGMSAPNVAALRSKAWMGGIGKNIPGLRSPGTSEGRIQKGNDGVWRDSNGVPLQGERLDSALRSELNSRTQINKSIGGQQNEINSLRRRLGIIGPEPTASALAQPSAEQLAKSVPSGGPARAGGVMGGNSGGTSIHAPISIQGGNSDPESLAQLVQKRLQETTRTRQHDLDYQGI